MHWHYPGEDEDLNVDPATEDMISQNVDYPERRKWFLTLWQIRRLETRLPLRG